MDGSKKEDTFYKKALDRKLIPYIEGSWHLTGEPSAYADLSKNYPIIIDNNSYNLGKRVIIVDVKNKTYRYIAIEDPTVERICRGLILKNSLNNL